MNVVLYDWPFLALVAGIGGLLYLLRKPRWEDPEWLVCLLLPVYMIHQFEEHGFDLLGRRYHFITEMCETLGHGSLDDCPADPGFIFAVNVGSVWIAGALAIALRKRNPWVGICGFGIPLVNAVAHIAAAIRHAAYNSGVFTSVVLFAPFCFLALRGFLRAGVIERKHLPFIVASGGVVHAVLMASVLAKPPYVVLMLIQVANGFVPFAFARIMRRRANP